MSAVVLQFRPCAARPRCAECAIPLHEHEIDARMDGQPREHDEQALCWQCEWFEGAYQQTRRAVEADARLRALEGRE